MAKRKNEFGEETPDAPEQASSSDPFTIDPAQQGAVAPAPLAAVETTAPLTPTEADVEAARAQLGGAEPPRAAPKGGEGYNAPLPEYEHPELEAPVAPPEYRVAPAAPDELEREEFERPSDADLADAKTVLVQTVDKRSAGIVVGGVIVGRTPVEVSLQSVKDRGPAHLRALLTDPRVQLKVV